MFKFIQIIGLSILSVVLLVGCNSNVLDNYDIVDKEVIYNKEVQSIEYIGELGDVEVIYENNNHIEVGTYEVKAIFSIDGIEKNSYATLKILPYELTIDDLNINKYELYDGSVKSITYDIIEDIEYSFVSENLYINSGVYYNTLIINSNNKNYSNTSIDIVFEILQNYNLILENTNSIDKEVEFNYDYHNVLLDNHNELISLGFTIDYLYNNSTIIPIESGVYSVDIIIEGNELYKELSSKLIINKKIIKPTIQGNGLIDLNTNFEFLIEVDSNYIDVEYHYYDINGSIIDKPNKVGHYFIAPVLNPLHSNYEIETTFKHFEIVLSEYDRYLLYNTTSPNLDVVYDGNPHSIILPNHNELINNGFFIEYSNDNIINNGIYNIDIIISKGGYHRKLTSILTINKLILDPSISDIQIKEQEDYHFTISNYNNIDYMFEYYNLNNIQIAKPMNYGNYYVKVVFNNENNNIIINDIIKYFNIELSEYNQSLIDNAYLFDKEVDYDGNIQSLSVSNSLKLRLERYIVTYTYNDDIIPPTEVGEYYVVATIMKNGTVIKTLNATLIIK